MRVLRNQGKMQFVYFAIVAIGLYFVSDWILKAFESYRGKRLENRQIAYFLIFAALAVLVFSAIERFAPA